MHYDKGKNNFSNIGCIVNILNKGYNGLRNPYRWN